MAGGGKDVLGNVPAPTKISKNSNVATTKTATKSEKQPDAPCPTVDAKPVPEDVPPKFASRTIPAQKHREVTAKTGGKCTYPCCTKPIENFHHAAPFAFSGSHESVVGLCKIHHAFCHNGVIKHELKDPSKWQLALEPHQSNFDNFYLKHKYSQLSLTPSSKTPPSAQ